MSIDKKTACVINYLLVSWSDGTSIGQNRVRNRIINEGCTFVDKDLNYGTRGYSLYLGYKVSANDANPVTNVVVYSSSKKQTWNNMDITIQGKKANYVRHDVDLNDGAGGNYVYLCETRDPQFAPLTGIAVEYQGDCFDGSWERAIGVETTDSGRDGIYNGDVNHNTRRGNPIFIRIKHGLIEQNHSPEEETTLQVSIKNSITKDVKDADVYICEGNVSVDEALNKTDKIEIRTNENGLCSTNHVKLKGKYTVVAHKKMPDGYLFGSQTVSIDKKTAYCEVNLDKRKRSFINYLRVSWSDGTSIGQNRVRDRIISEGCTLVDKDLNYGARGYFIYLGYKVSINDTRPVTNVVVYSSSKKQTWHDMNITVLGKKANYVRHDVDLNNGAGGNYVYLCETRDPQFAPLTGIDVECKGDYFDGSWERAIGVETTDSGRDRTYNGDVNHKTRHGDSIFIRIKRD